MFILLTMIFCHIVDDFYLQGILADMKQRNTWKKLAPSQRYRYDYIAALVIHAFSWSFLVMIVPTIALMMCEINTLWCVIFVVNIIVHVVVDDLKANKLKINLVTDQTIHLLQVVTTWCLLCL